MFTKAVLRLTGWYLAIIILLGIMFSLALYQVSSRELDSIQQRQETLLRGNPFLARDPGFARLNDARIAQIEDSREHIILNLIYFNLFIILVGGGVGFLLALRTLQPIQAALEAQSRFTGDASHELRTPLTVMRSEIEVALRDSSLTLGQSKELLESVLEEIAALETLSGGLLKLAQQHEGELPETFHPCNLREIAEEAVKRVRVLAEKKDLTIENQAGEQVVEGERWSLVELATILLDNAIKYSQAGSKIVVATGKRHHGQEAFLSVADQGIGISEEDQAHIFDRFYRADRSRSRGAAGGYGLGLSIAKRIVDMHGGTIEVRSEPEKGSEFTVVLPVDHAKRWWTIF